MARNAKWASAALAIVLLLSLAVTAQALPILLDVTGYGYNVDYQPGPGYLAPDGQNTLIGCGPTTGAMLLEYYTRHGAPGLIVDPLADARLMGSATYMNTNAGGFGPSSDFHFGLEEFAYDRGWIVDAKIHKEPTTHVPSPGWDGVYGSDLVLDATFWNTTTWNINQGAFLDFLAAQIDAGNPVSLSVASEGIGGGADHWMAGVGYNRDTGMWAGYNTWDNSLHWYTPTSAFMDTDLGTAGIQVPAMSIAYVRTFTLVGPVERVAAIPEPCTLLLLGVGSIGAAVMRRKATS